MTSRFVMTVVFFAVVCGLAATFNMGRVPALKFPEKTWASWSIGDFLTSSQKPQVVFLGSSLVLVPLQGVDANLLNEKLDGCEHHTSEYFERYFKKATGTDVHSFNLAMPGEMPSDAYLITDFLLEYNKKPDVLVYGVGPRDFMDNTLPSPAATDPFRSLARFGEINGMIDRVMPDLTDRFNYEIGRVVYLYGLRQDLCAQIGEFLTRQFDTFVPLPAGKKPTSVALRRLMLRGYRPSELNKGDAFFRPHEKEEFADNVAEYRKRYGTVKWDTFTTQMRFFTELLDVARVREIKVVIVSMPITDINRSLIKDYAWDAYRQSVRLMAILKGATYIDLQGGGKFNTQDFMDTVHLNSAGGKKMLDEVVAEMAKSDSVRSALQIKEPDKHAKQQVARVSRRNAL